MVADDFVDDVNRARRDLQDCFDDLEACERRADDGTEVADCIGDFRRCTERANRDKEEACSEFAREFREVFSDASRDARREGLEDEFLNDPTVQDKVDTAEVFGGVCGRPPDEPPAPNEDNVCGAAFCATDVTRANRCNSFLANCADPATGFGTLEQCVAAGLFICRGGPPPPEESPPPPPEDTPVCDAQLCGLSEAREQECRTFLSNCLAVEMPDECLGGAFFFCRHE